MPDSSGRLAGWPRREARNHRRRARPSPRRVGNPREFYAAAFGPCAILDRGRPQPERSECGSQYADVRLANVRLVKDTPKSGPGRRRGHREGNPGSKFLEPGFLLPLDGHLHIRSLKHQRLRMHGLMPSAQIAQRRTQPRLHLIGPSTHAHCSSRCAHFPLTLLSMKAFFHLGLKKMSAS